MRKRIYIALSLFLLLTTITFNEKILIPRFALKKVEIENNYLVKEDSLKKELFQFYGKNLLFLKNREVEKILLKNTFVESFIIKKQYPDSLKIKIFEKKPIAILVHKKEKFYLSEKINLIKFKEIQIFQNLPYVFGSQKEFKILYNNLKLAGFPINLIEKYTFFDSKRWDLEINNNIVIKLPSKNYVKSLKNFVSIKNNKNFKKYGLFDYRIKDQLILK